MTMLAQWGALIYAWWGDISKIEPSQHLILAFSLWAPLIAGLSLLPGLLLRGQRLQHIVRTLLAATAASFLLLLPRLLLPPEATYAAGLSRAALGTLFGLGMMVLGGKKGRFGRSHGLTTALALLLGMLLLLPWLKFGALGNGWDVVVAALQALGLALSLTGLSAYLLPGLVLPGRSSRRTLFLAGVTLSIAFFILGGSWGQMDYQALLMGVLPALGFPMALFGLQNRRTDQHLNAMRDEDLTQGRKAAKGDNGQEKLSVLASWRETVFQDGRYPVGSGLLLAWLATFGPLAFFDPVELNLYNLFSGEAAKWAAIAATWTVVMGWLFVVIALWACDRWVQARRPRMLWGLAGAATLAAVAVYLLAGQPGFFGDDFFVVMKTQADLSPAYSMSEIDARRAWVYQTLVETADADQADLRAWLDARGIAYTPYYLTNGIEVHASALRRWQLRRRSDVLKIVYSPELRPIPKLPPTDPGDTSAPTETPWGLQAIGAPKVWDELGVRGAGIVVGQSDSGVDATHPALAAHYRGRRMGSDAYNWLDAWYGKSTPYDLNGHGTHTLATAVGGEGVGVAPEAEWFACTNLVRAFGSPAYYLTCMQFMLAPYPADGDAFRDGRPDLAADISTNSWGCPHRLEGCDEETLWFATSALRAAGIFFVAAAGNEGPACNSLQTPPGNYGNVLSVGALTPDGDLADFSNRGPETLAPDNAHSPDLIAPGVDVLSAWPDNRWYRASGTSMAAPHVAGVVALMWSANPALRGHVAETERMLIATARPYQGRPDECGQPGVLPDPGYGFGVIDAYAAVKAALDWRP